MEVNFVDQGSQTSNPISIQIDHDPDEIELELSLSLDECFVSIADEIKHKETQLSLSNNDTFEDSEIINNFSGIKEPHDSNTGTSKKPDT